jgi:hypothetical protein
MESSAIRAGVDLTTRPTYPGLALVLALISVPGSTVAWDSLPGGGFAFRVPPAIAAIVLGVQALRHAQGGRRKAIAAIAVGALMLVQMLTWMTVESLSGNNEGASQKATPTAEGLNKADGIRYDGGPDEGTRGIVRSTPSPAGSPPTTSSDGTRYDGGPEEGTRGIRHSTAASPAQVYVNPSTGYPGTGNERGN